MSLDLKTVATLYRTELRMAVRDKRTVFFSLVLPLALMPIIMFSSIWVQKKRTTELAAMTHRYTVIGPEAQAARAWIAEALARSGEAGPGPQSKTPTTSPNRFETTDVFGPEEALQRGDLSFYLVAERETEAKGAELHSRDTEPAVAGSVRLTFVYRGDRDTSRDAAFELRHRLADVRRDLRTRLLRTHGFPVSPTDVARTAEENVASARQVAGLSLGRMLTFFLLLFVFTGGAVVATVVSLTLWPGRRSVARSRRFWPRPQAATRSSRPRVC